MAKDLLSTVEKPLAKGEANNQLREYGSVAATLFLTIIAGWVANYSIQNANYFLIAISMGALGGLVHEFAQSGGKILFIQKAEDGYYLGSIAGIVLGAVAGILYIRGEIALLDNPAYEVNVNAFAIDVFIAGLGLKGLTEAASGKAVTSSKNNDGKDKKNKKGIDEEDNS